MALRLASTVAADPSSVAIRSLAVALLPHLLELLAIHAQGAELVDVLQTVPGPRRTLLGACRRGELESVKVGRRYLATRAAIDAYLRACGPRVVTSTEKSDELEETRRRLAMPGRRRRRSA